MKIIVLLLAIITSSCQKIEEEPNNDLKQKSNQIKKEISSSNSNPKKQDSTIVIYYPNGEPRYIQNYNAWGDLTGEWLNYYENGQIKQKGHYSNGQAGGLWTYYNEDGTIKNEEFIELDTNCVKFVALWDSETISKEIGKTKKWVFLNYTVNIWDNPSSYQKRTKLTQLRASSYAELLDFNGEDYLVKAPMDKKIGWLNKKHVKGFALKNRETKKLCD